VWLGMLIGVLLGRRRAARPSEDTEWRFVDIRPPIPREEAQRLAGWSGGRMTWDRSGVQQAGFSVRVEFHGGRRANIVAFTQDFPPKLVVDRLQIGLPLDELLRRYPSLTRDAPVLDPERPAPPEGIGTATYAGACTQSGHEIVVTLRDDRVVGFSLGVTGTHERGKAFLRTFYESRRKAAENVAARKRQRERFMGNLATTRDDDDAMLAAWARDHEDGPRLARWLRTRATPDDWHACALTWNWDFGLQPLFWIIRREDCDVATALHIFSLAEPSYYITFNHRPEEIPEVNIEGFWLSSEIFERWRSGFYKRSELAWSDVGGMPKRLLGRDGRAHRIPEAMKAPLAGRSVSTEGFEEGFPSRGRRRRRDG